MITRRATQRSSSAPAPPCWSRNRKSSATLLRSKSGSSWKIDKNFVACRKVPSASRRRTQPIASLQRWRNTPSMQSVRDVDPSTLLGTGIATWLTRERHRVHLIGVAGSGMSGLAGLLLALGHQVSGSDKVRTVEIERLCGLGLQFHLGQDAANVGNADLVIYSSAIKPGNGEYDEATRTRRNMARRAEALAAIMHAKKGV